MKTKAIPRVSVNAEICHNTTMVRRAVSQPPVAQNDKNDTR